MNVTFCIYLILFLRYWLVSSTNFVTDIKNEYQKSAKGSENKTQNIFWLKQLCIVIKNVTIFSVIEFSTVYWIPESWSLAINCYIVHSWRIKGAFNSYVHKPSVAWCLGSGISFASVTFLTQFSLRQKYFRKGRKSKAKLQCITSSL
jgi:hypothetical protein